MNIKHDLYIAAPDLPMHEHKLLLSALNLLFRNGMKFHMLQEATVKAHLLVLDADTTNGQQMLQASRQGQVKLLIATTPKNGKNIISLKKPFNIQSLAVTLSRLFIKMQEQLAHKAKVNKQSQAQQQQPTSGNQTLFSLLLDAKEQKKILRISCAPHPDIFADGINRSLVTCASHAEIKEIMKRPFTDMSVAYLPETEFAVHKSAINVFTLHNILWIAGLECSSGVILDEHNIDQPIKLRAWPNFTRNDFKAEHLKLAAFMAKQSLSITELAAVTNLALGEVINFYNAAYAVDLIEFSDKSEQQVVGQRATARQQQGLFAKIANRLNIWK